MPRVKGDRRNIGAHLRTHGLSGTQEYAIWCGIRKRCFNKNDPHFPHYGGRGITVCDRWSWFPNFLGDMGARPSPKHSVDRINNDGNYEPGNCRWVTQKEQCNNKRNCVSKTEKDIMNILRRQGYSANAISKLTDRARNVVEMYAPRLSNPE